LATVTAHGTSNRNARATSATVLNNNKKQEQKAIFGFNPPMRAAEKHVLVNVRDDHSTACSNHNFLNKTGMTQRATANSLRRKYKLKKSKPT
jgi:hypothetical protein